MAKKPKAPKVATPLPSREEVLAFIAEHPGEAGRREIARAFGIRGGADKIALKAMLKDLETGGAVEKRRGRLTRPGDLPPVTVLEIGSRDRDGEFIAVPTEWPSEEGDPPRIVVAPGKGAGPAPGVGDRVLARIAAGEDGYTARVIKVLARRPSTVYGVVRRTAQGAQVEPVDRKQRVLVIAPEALKGAREGDLVAVRVTRSTGRGPDRAVIEEVVGSMKDEKAVSLIAILTHAIPHEFPPEVLQEAATAKAAPLRGRDDWREMPLITIDPADAKDHDDAVHAEADADPKNPDGFIVTVAIADVAWYVRPGSALDREALRRGNSVYFPDRVVPMLPERISNDLCSLREHEDRPAMAVRMVFGADGRKRGHRFHRIMMRSAAKLSYREAQDAFDGRDVGRGDAVRDALAVLWRGYAALRRGREGRDPLELDIPERKVLLKPDGTIERIVVPERLESHRLIEEFMIQANVAAAETLEEKKSPLVYRIHDTPSMAKLETLREFLRSIDVNLPKGGNLRPAHFNRILERVKESEHGRLVHEVVLRTQAQAEYNPENIGHFGLNLRRYAHFTSPIRRYADLIVHRALIRALRLGAGGLSEGMEASLPEIAAQISATERRAMAAERDTIDRLVAHWLAERVGAIFPGRVSGVTRAGLFVKLDETGADGFVPIATLGSDYFVFDEARHAVIGRATGEMHRLGDAVQVKLIEAAPLAGALRFELLSEGRIMARKDRPREDRSRKPKGRGGRPEKKRGRR